ncbi:GatB/YqeY domain-containing protein [Candidatus Berkelbacteria bacterium]|nr:GatB/YqeY domain-containing protein [Candidatus Berkelbacteria bacterium]
MSIEERIDQDLKAALKGGQSDVVSVLRLARAGLKNKQIELGHPLTDSEVIPVLQKEVKQRQDSIDQYRAAKRDELADKEAHEAEILQRYLPAQLSDEELQTLVQTAIGQADATTMADMGRVIGAVMAEVRGKADGRRVSALVKQQLSR